MDPRDKAITVVASVAVAIGIILYATFVSPGFQSHPNFDYFLVIAIMLGILPPGLIDLSDRRWRVAINDALPSFLRDVTEGIRTGMTFTKALESTTRRDYGVLSVELRRTFALISWGYSYRDALEDLARRVDTPIMHHTTVLLNEVGYAGGKLGEILETVYEHIGEVQDLEQEKRRQVSPYVAVIYSSFGVYIFLVFILFSTFFSQMETLRESGAPFGGGISVGTFFVWFFHLSVIEGLIAGLVIGKISEGALAAGLKHAFSLILLAFIVFFFIIA